MNTIIKHIYPKTEWRAQVSYQRRHLYNCSKKFWSQFRNTLPQQTRGTHGQCPVFIAHVLVQCRPIVCDAGPTLNQHMGNVPCLLGMNVFSRKGKRQYLLTWKEYSYCCLFLLRDCTCCILHANTKHPSNVGLMLGQRRRPWTSIAPTLDQRVMFAGMLATGANPANKRRSSNVVLKLGQRHKLRTNIIRTLGQLLLLILMNVMCCKYVGAP